MLHLYSVYHLNLAYSSIEEEQRPKVINNCYWPILDLIDKYDIPLAIEASGHTLEIIKLIDPKWLSKFKSLLKLKKCEFIGSGYAQIIGPLVPAEVNDHNLKIGNDIYKQLLGVVPQIALINEQAYSQGLVEHYINNSYKAIIMEWENPFIHHSNWGNKISYMPQYVLGTNGKRLPVIWNKSVAFQKFQRYVHGEYELSEYLDYLDSQISNSNRIFPLYCNDAEIFNFRPNRYDTEEKLTTRNEWDRISLLYNKLTSTAKYKLIPPAKALEFLTDKGSKTLKLETSELPIPVKKQGKYNITRWAVTGRNDLEINTECWRIFNRLVSCQDYEKAKWKELCYLWSSDFRTHITQKRWDNYRKRLKSFYRKFHLKSDFKYADNYSKLKPFNSSKDFLVNQKDKYLEIENDKLKLILNCRKGLTINKLWFKNKYDKWLCGTLHHGYFDDINWGADFFTGHLVFETPGEPKLTDLTYLKPDLFYDENEKELVVNGIIKTSLGIIEKNIHICSMKDEIKIIYKLHWKDKKIGSLRLGHITLNPEAFAEDSLLYKTSNGGYNQETFRITNMNIDHTSPVSFLVSSSSGIGITDSLVEIGDNNNTLKIEIDKNLSALIGLITCKKINNSFFYRLTLSAQELDETSMLDKNNDKITKNYRPNLFSFSIHI